MKHSGIIPVVPIAAWEGLLLNQQSDIFLPVVIALILAVTVTTVLKVWFCSMPYYPSSPFYMGT